MAGLSPTWLAARRSAEISERCCAERDSTVKALMAHVPGAEIVAVRPTMEETVSFLRNSGKKAAGGREAKIKAAAEAMRLKRSELYAQPLAAIFEQLAAAAIDAAALVE